VDQRALKVKRMPALLALLLAVFALLPAAAAAEHRVGSPVAASAIETPAATLDHQPAEASFAEPGDSDPSDGGDAAILLASARPAASLASRIEQSSSFECPAHPTAANRARAPPTL